jgi:PBSX family phage terminase large subunit
MSIFTPQSIKAQLTKKQIEVLKFDNLYKPRLTILEGAVRSGKTHINNILFINHMKRLKNAGIQGQHVLMTGNTLSTLRNNVLDDFQALGIDTRGVNSQHNYFELFGNKVICLGCGNVDAQKKIRGITLYGHYGNEMTLHHKEATREIIKRLSGEGARLFWDTNPDNPGHYIKTDFIDNQNEKFLKHVVHFKFNDNDKLPAEYIEQTMLAIPKNTVAYQRGIEGLWVAGGDVIYSRYETKEMRFIKPLKDFDEIIAGCDFGRGGQSPYAFLLIGRIDKTYYIFDEYIKNRCTTAEFINYVDSELTKYDTAVKRQMRVYCDGADPDKIKEFRQSGFDAVPADKTAGSVERGIEFCINTDIVINKLNCPVTISEIGSYEWKRDGNGNAMYGNPVKFNDHTCDAFRYALYTSHGKQNSSITFVPEVNEENNYY